jgi:hypothetical protein
MVTHLCPKHDSTSQTLELRYNKVTRLNVFSHFNEPIYNPTKPTNSMEQSILLQKLTVTQLFKKFPAFYEIRNLTVVFTKGRHKSLS